MQKHELIERLGLPGELIMFAPFGSHLYGTDTPASDRDFKGVYMPTVQQILTGKIPRTYSWGSKKSTAEGAKNAPDDIDIEVYSLHYFLHLLCQGDTVSMDMIHIKPGQCNVSTPIWEILHANRSKAYSTDMRAFVGYARKQAAKYGIKGSRLDAIDRVISFLKEVEKAHGGNSPKLGDVWNYLPGGDHLHKVDPSDLNPHRTFEVCGKRFHETIRVSEILRSLERVQEGYGHRAKLAKANQGIDWKAVSHAFRAARQMEEIFKTGDLVYPLWDSTTLRKIKAGEMDFITEVAPALESLMDQVEVLATASLLPKHIDQGYWDEMLARIILKEILRSQDH